MVSATFNGQMPALRGLFRSVERFREVDNDMPVAQMSVLMYVALHPEATQREIIRDLDMASSTVSRSVASLSEVHRLGKPGLGLLTWFDDPTDRRTKRLMLTRKGETFMTRLAEG